MVQACARHCPCQVFGVQEYFLRNAVFLHVAHFFSF